MKKRVLIVCFTFPPYPGIGGRRWAKFAKFLHKQGTEVFVLTARRKKAKGDSLWSDNIKDLKRENIFTYKNLYPEILQRTDLSFWDKIKYRFALLVVKSFCKGNPYDRAAFDRLFFLKRLDIIVKRHSIKNIIVTGAPFNLLYYCVNYQKQNSQVNLFTDMRDPWTWGIGYGYSLLNQKRKRRESQKELEVLFRSNRVFTPVRTMCKILKERYPEYQNKIEILPHCFDPDDTVASNQETGVKDKTCIRFIYGGTLYDNAIPILEELACFYQNNSKSKICYDLYIVNKQHKTEQLQIKFNSFLNFNNAVSPRELFKEIRASDFYVAIFPDEFKDFISTKFYEIISLKKPIILISNPGELSAFIVKNRLGYHILPSQISSKIKSIVEGDEVLDYNNSFDVSQFSFAFQGQRLNNMLF